MDVGAPLLHQVQHLSFEQAVSDGLAEVRNEQLVQRIWQRDAALWSGQDEANWLGWLEAPRAWQTQLGVWQKLRDELKQEGVTTLVLAGMGGSSLCPLVWEQIFGGKGQGVAIRVVDSTVPGQIRHRTADISWERTVVCVSSKSGTTAETTALAKLFRTRLEAALSGSWPRRMIAITDPGTALEAQAASEKFRYCAVGDPHVGGRYSAFTPYGLLPAVLGGVPVEEVLQGAHEAMEKARLDDERQNEGLLLGVVMGTAGRTGRDKLTLVSSPSIAALALWIEQLVAESTGKNGRGIVPVVAEPLGPAEVYSDDRLFIYLRDENAPDASQDLAVQELIGAGQPVLSMPVRGAASLGYLMYAWEFATAVAGAVLRVNPFDQPDVELTKRKTRELLAGFRETGRLDLPEWSRQTGDLAFYVSDLLAPVLNALRDGGTSAAFEAFTQIAASNAAYIAINAFLPETRGVISELNWLRRILRDATRRAVPFGWGPRYLHSTGQLHKGGPDGGMFLFLTSQDEEDIPVPGEAYTFGVLKQAQVFGDVRALEERGRPVVCVDLGPDPLAGLARLRIAIEEAVGMSS